MNNLAHLLMLSAAPPPSPPPPSGWRQVNIGGGGLVSGINITSSGGTVTKLIRNDACGPYKFNDATQKWDQLITTTSMPSTDVGSSPAQGPAFWNGVYEIVAAPSNPSTIYMAYPPGNELSDGNGNVKGYVYKSTDGGGSFARTAGWTKVYFGPNVETVKQMGPKMAVDPVNPDVVYIGTQFDGAFVTYNGGTTWAKVPNVTNSTGNFPAVGFCFDTTSGTTTNTGGSGVRTNTIYLCSNGSGIWHSTNGGTSFSAMVGSPDHAQNCVISTDGTFYVTTDSAITGSAGVVWRFQSATWTNVTPTIGGFDTICLTVSPFAAGTLIASHNGGSYSYSLDHGATWDRSSGISSSITATDAPWLATNAAFFSQASIVMDPLVNGKLWVTTGIGVFTTQMPVSGPVTVPTVYTSHIAGIEEIVVNDIVSVPGGAVYTVNWDRPVFKITDPTVYPTTYYPTYVITDQIPIERGSSLDYASSDPTYLAVIANTNAEDSGFSSDSGVTWARFGVNQSTLTTGAGAGSIACASPSVQVIAQANQGDVYYTTDGWATISIKITAAIWNANGATGMINANPPVRSNNTGWGFAAFLTVRRVAADRTASNTFLIFNSNANSAGGGFYKLTFPAGVLTIARMGDVPQATCAFNARVKSVPNLGGINVAGHYFHATGPGQSTAMYRTTNYGFGSGSSGWTAVQGTGETYCFGFGAVKPGNDYPSVFVCGVINGTFGIYQADCSAATWTANTSIPWVQLSNNLPLNSTDQPRDISGDLNNYGRVYLGYGGMNTVYLP